MNFITENFNAGGKPLDIFLYLGVLLVAYILFQDKINPLLVNLKQSISKIWSKSSSVDLMPDFDLPAEDDHSDIFFELIQSWKKTRDLAELYGADQAVTIADQMFPHLIPKEDNNEE